MKYIKIITAIIVALLGAFGSYMGYKASQRVDAQAAIAAKQIAMEIKALMAQMNTLIIPQLQMGLNNIRLDVKEAIQDESADRERLARLEAIVEILSKRHRAINREIKVAREKPTVLMHTQPVILPMLTQQKQLP